VLFQLPDPLLNHVCVTLYAHGHGTPLKKKDQAPSVEQPIYSYAYKLSTPYEDGPLMSLQVDVSTAINYPLISSSLYNGQSSGSSSSPSSHSSSGHSSGTSSSLASLAFFAFFFVPAFGLAFASSFRFCLQTL